MSSTVWTPPVSSHTPWNSTVQTCPWPAIPVEDRELAQLIAGRVIHMRGNEPASVAHEERLREDVASVVARGIEAPHVVGLPVAAASDLATNRRFRDAVERNAVILASHLYPVSLLVYGADLENITCLAADHWLVSTVGRKLVLIGNSPFGSDDECLEYFRRVIRLRGVIGDQSVTDAAPIAEASVGSVVRIVVAKRPAISGRAAIKASIRIPSRSRVRDLADYVSGMVMSDGIARFLEALVRGKANIMIAGGTCTGKTTLLRVLCGMVQEEDHLVVIEDGAELHLDQDRGDGRPWHALTSAVSTIPSIRVEAESRHLTMFDLIRHSLRFQPDRVILGESRGEEMAAVCKALMTGHEGSMTTIHAEDAELALDQATQYVMENPRFTGNEKMSRRIVEQAIQVVVHVANQEGRRRLTGILAVEPGGNHKWVYRQTETGGWRRMTDLIGNLGRLAPRIVPHLGGDEVPAP